MLIDDVKIRISAGHGGKGKVAFNTVKMSLGPTGASGGRGGNVYAEGVSDLSALGQFRFKKVFEAESGMPGQAQFRDGIHGKDLVLKLPVGTVIHNLTSNSDTEISKIGEKILLAEGGFGGKGNYHFRSPTNTTPKEFQPGLPGEEFDLHLELKLIADVGFVGLPNVGKSSLLNAITRAQSKVANYPFTTLEPNLGVYYELILADIPGLIEGSSQGKGLGIKFLKHVERTGTLFHFISSESETPEKDYRVIRNELEEYNKALLKKTEYLFLTKADLLTPAEVKKKLALLSKISPQAVAFSIHDEASLGKVKKILNKLKDDKFMLK
ncbi:GTPase ObgE [Candidatus Giovannonibacteria bacterium]|nr:GTPase ObgE [Candidatus Giovannonibacteria bacterium]